MKTIVMQIKKQGVGMKSNNCRHKIKTFLSID
jgi:hypothetical protein